MTRRRRVPGCVGESGLGVGQFVLLFPLHPAILEPNFYLSLRQTQRVSYLDAPAPGQVPVEVEFLFQLQDLMTGVRRPRTLAVAVERTIGCWKRKT